MYMQAGLELMTTHAELLAARRAAASAIDVEILSVATAVPQHVTGQQEIAERAQKIFPQYARLDALYRREARGDPGCRLPLAGRACLNARRAGGRRASGRRAARRGARNSARLWV